MFKPYDSKQVAFVVTVVCNVVMVTGPTDSLIAHLQHESVDTMKT